MGTVMALAGKRNEAGELLLTTDFPLTDLPDDVLSHVLSFLPGNKLLPLRTVCQRWRIIIDSQKLWHDKCRREGVFGRWLGAPIPEDFCRFYFQRPYTRNLLKNPCAKEGYKHWKQLQTGGDGFRVEQHHDGSDPITDYAPVSGNLPCWATSYEMCSKAQMIDLIKEGVSDVVLDTVRPAIEISEWYSARWDCASTYTLQVTLLKGDQKTVVVSYEIDIDVTPRKIWHQAFHSFEQYEPGVRFVQFTHGGKDNQFWAGHYGPKFTLASVKLKFKH